MAVSMSMWPCSVGRCPLIPAFSPSGGEGVRRTDEGEDAQTTWRRQHFLIRSSTAFFASLVSLPVKILIVIVIAAETDSD
jgi:hypothetical protein